MSPIRVLHKLGFTLATLCIVVFGALATAKADTVYSLTVNNFGQSGSLGTITTHLITSGTDIGCIQVNVSLNTNYVIHSTDALGFNQLSAAFTNVHILATSVPTHFTVGDGGTFDGFGSRGFSLDGETTSDARIHLDQIFSFTVCADQPFTNSNQLTAFAVQIALKTAGGATGFANSTIDGTPTPTGTIVPEPTSMVLLGTGLIGMAAGIRRRLRK